MNCKGHCALVRAARNGHAEIIRLLIALSNDKAWPLPKTLQLALAWAASRGHTAAVEVLLDAGAETNGVTPAGHTALALAERNHHEKVCKYLRRYISENRIEAPHSSSAGSTPSAYIDTSSCSSTSSTSILNGDKSE